MTIITLRPGNAANCRPGHLRVGWDVEGNAALTSAVDVEVSRADGTPMPPNAVHMTDIGGRHEAVVLIAPDALRVTMRPVVGGQFAGGTRVQVHLTISAPGGMNHVLSEPRDVSGLSDAVVFDITTQPDGSWLVHCADSASDDRDLPRIVLTARDAARRFAGGARATTTVDFAVVVDRSASMLASARDGLLDAVLGAIAGIDHVYGSGASIRVADAPLVPRQQPGTLSAAAPEQCGSGWLRANAPRSGVAFTPLAAHLTPPMRRGVVFIVTDDCPPDIDALAELASGNPQLHWHFVVLATSRYDFQGGMPSAALDLLAGFGVAESHGILQLTAVDPTQPGLAELIENNDALMDLLVASLVRHSVPAGPGQATP